MARVRKTPSGRYELRIRSKLLPKDVYLTFNDEAAAHSYGQQVEDLLKDGVVPASLIDTKVEKLDTVAQVVRAWRQKGSLSSADDGILNQVVVEAGHLRLNELSYKWTEGWIEQLKRENNLAPGTVRKRVGALSRALDWYLRSHPDVAMSNPLRLLPKGYSTYTAKDAAALKATKGRVKTDVIRDRRLQPEEEQAIVRALSGQKRPDRERPLPADPAFQELFFLILGTGVRLREAYTLRKNQIGATTIKVQSGKTKAGVEEYRVVPLLPQLRQRLAKWTARMRQDDLVFPFWSGEDDDLDRTTAKLSRRFTTLFEYAGAPGLTEHDLRHEATCRWFEMRTKGGSWLYREGEIRRIMGWSPNSPMPARYASFRVEDLASRLG
jgi:integrase